MSKIAYTGCASIIFLYINNHKHNYSYFTKPQEINNDTSYFGDLLNINSKLTICKHLDTPDESHDCKYNNSKEYKKAYDEHMNYIHKIYGKNNKSFV